MDTTSVTAYFIVPLPLNIHIESSILGMCID